MITGLNHITFAVTDLHTSLTFYRDVLGCKEVLLWEGGAYLEAGNVWLCLSVDPSYSGEERSDYSHIAFSVADKDFDTLRTKIIQSGARIWKDNRSEGASVYFCDPMGHRLEIHVGSLGSRLEVMRAEKDSEARCGSST